MRLNRRGFLTGSTTLAAMTALKKRALAQPGSPPSIISVPYIYAANAPYYVVANGVTDQTTQLQAALTAAGAIGGTVILPSGTTVVNGTGLTMPAGTGIAGQINQRNYITQPTLGSILYSPYASYASGTVPLITMTGGNTIRSVSIWGAGNGSGSSTTRPNIQATGQQNYLVDVTSENGYVGLDCNYTGVTFADNCSFAANVTGISVPIDSQFTACVFSSNQSDIYFGAGASTNRVANCRFEFNGSGPSVNFYGNSNGSTVTTNSGTASGTTLHFASTTGITNGYMVYNQTTPASIAPGTYVASGGGGGTTVTLSGAVSSAVGSSDVIEFYIPNVEMNNITGCQFDRAFTNAIALNYARHITVTGCTFRRCAAGATSNTSGDASVYMGHSSGCVVSGNTMYVGTADNGSGPYSPSFGVWDSGVNYQCILKNNTIIYNPVDGTHGAGINTTANFTNFNTDNTSALANTVIKGYP